MSIKTYFQNFWQKSLFWQSLSLFEKSFFILLIWCEYLYRMGFWCSRFFKTVLKVSYRSPLCIISVGNISAGGTGKSVVVPFIVQHLNNEKCAIVLRGYKGNIEAERKNIIMQPASTLEYVGDEAFMYYNTLSVPIVVGPKKVDSLKLVEKNLLLINVCVIDDGYQTFDIQKDVEILLLDGRSIFENGHCFPAGRLREKDISRADCIIITHSENISQIEKEILVTFLKNYNVRALIVWGCHTPTGLTNPSSEKIAISQVGSYIAFAAIGSFDGFLKSLRDAGIKIAHSYSFSDHHTYSFQDVLFLSDLFQQGLYDGMITTRKDWYKIVPLWKSLKKEKQFPLFCLDIEFKFISPKDHILFFSLIEKAIKIKKE